MYFDRDDDYFKLFTKAITFKIKVILNFYLRLSPLFVLEQAPICFPVGPNFKLQSRIKFYLLIFDLNCYRYKCQTHKLQSLDKILYEAYVINCNIQELYWVIEQHFPYPFLYVYNLFSVSRCLLKWRELEEAHIQHCINAGGKDIMR